MSFLKKFFENKKKDVKFKAAGPGVKLSDTKQREEPNVRPNVQHVNRERSDAAQTAGAAALARIQSKEQASNPNWSQTYLKAQIKREEEKGKVAARVPQPQPSQPSLNPKECSSHAPGVFFCCPMIGPEVLPREEMQGRIKQFLYEQLEEDRALAACLIIHSCNKNKEKIGGCIEILHKYLTNIVNNISEEKYRKIRVNNKIFQEKVASLEGTQDFLLGAGFELKTLDHQGSQEDFWVFPEEKIADNILEEVMDALISAEPIKPQLDRALKVLEPSQVSRPLEIPPDFFCLSGEELKREQQVRSEDADRQLQLRTKAMRERDERREARKYRYCFIRIRFPDNYLLQGTFGVHEKMPAVKEFIRENLENSDVEFSLRLLDSELTNSEESLVDLDLPPASVLIITFPGGEKSGPYMKPDVMALVQSL